MKQPLKYVNQKQNIMKTLIKHIAFISILSVTFFSCSKDDDDSFQEEVGIQELLIGKWTYSEVDGGPLEYCPSQSYYQFIDNENALFHDLSLTSFSDPEECISLLGEEVLTYTLEENNQIITFSSTFGSYSKKIVSISQNRLILDFVPEADSRPLTLIKE